MALTDPISLIPANPATLVAAAAATGAQQHFSPVPLFTVRGVLVLHVSGTFSVGTIDVEVSLDGGASFVVASAALNVASTKYFAVTNIMVGAIYRLNVKTFTGTSVTIVGILN